MDEGLYLGVMAKCGVGGHDDGPPLIQWAGQHPGHDDVKLPHSAVLFCFLFGYNIQCYRYFNATCSIAFCMKLHIRWHIT